MYSPVVKGVAAAGVAATGIALSDRDRRDALAGVTNGSIRFVRAFGWGAAVSFDYKYRYDCQASGTFAAKGALGQPRVSMSRKSD